MIRRLNSAALAPPCLAAAPTSLASKEQVKAAKHYAKVPPPKSAYKFRIYKEPEVKAALATLFANKCAYCEFRLDGAPFDVEHYRPKGEVVEDDGSISGGYWWLASAWTNLLPSCQDCNRGRYHETPTGGLHLYGKENLFPLLDTPRSTALGGEAAERPGLLNPTIDDPRDHLVFGIDRLPNGKETSIVSAKPRDDGTPDPRGEATRHVVGLNRNPLARARMERILCFRLALGSIEKSWKDYKGAPNPGAAAAVLAVIKQETSTVWELYLAWTAPYSAACRADYRRWAGEIVAMIAA